MGDLVYAMSMSQSPYEKTCNRCGSKILMQTVNGKWDAYILDGTAFHRCFAKNGNGAKAPSGNKKDPVMVVSQRKS